jgi:uncharacterized protein with beta-barrel porin domain
MAQIAWRTTIHRKCTVGFVATVATCIASTSVVALPSLPPLPLSTPLNPLGAANAINSGLQGTPVAPAAFVALSSLPVPALTGTLNQLAGNIGADLGTVADQVNAPLLDTLMQRLGNGGGVVVPPGEAAGAPSLPTPSAPWASAIGGHSTLSGDTASGAEHLSAGVAGLAAGVETGIGGQAILGASVSVAHESTRAGPDGASRSNDVTLALYGRYALLGQGYAAGALAYGWHDVTTDRTVSVSGTDMLEGKFTGHDLGGRFEMGWRLNMPGNAVLAPFLAFSGDAFSTPAYGESAVAGAPTFALVYGSNTVTSEHIETGLHLARFFGQGGDGFSVGADAAWAHQLSGPPVVDVAFASLSSSSFRVRGLVPARDTALLGLGVQKQDGNGLSYGVRGDGQFGDGITALSGTLNLVYRF